MKKTILHLICLFFVLPVFGQYTVTGGQGQPLLAKEDAPVKVYLLNGLSGAEISYTSDTEEPHQWYKYNVKANEKIPIPCRQNKNTSTITDVSEGWGYSVGLTNAPSTSYVWIIDYSTKQPSFLNFEVQEEGDKCEFLKLITDVLAPPLAYQGVNGEQRTLQRKYHLVYDEFKWKEDDLDFIKSQRIDTLTGILSEIVIDAPLINTSFTLKGDEYAEHFGINHELTIPKYTAVALDVHSWATLFKEEGDDELYPNESRISGSAPLTITFDAYANDPVASLYIWEIKKIDPATKDSVTVKRTDSRSLTHEFKESGTFHVQLEVTSIVGAQPVCVDKSQFYTVFIGESDLKLPNAFSPGSSYGTNDEYKVVHKSLVSFKASIYNRWGNLLFQWNDPDKGWDGRVSGKLVPTGVYFIVVEAKGADGKSYTMSKDINILRSKNN
ncbi:MAG: gliding motility-associated C-terminal domain-containing protein [Candidatus Symbiothrix sp.]|jgi:gliding motility-associated-like protein|nr:gliding motility-associated C-terminal domain-containing protein [Candidatus Symbiothrix sp.]